MEMRWIYRIIGMADKFSGEDRGGRAWWRRCGTTGIDTVAEEMWNGNRWDVGRRRWRNGLEGQRRTGKISTGNDYQSEGVSLLQKNGYGIQGKWWRQRRTSMVEEMSDNIYEYDGGGDVGWQQNRCGMAEIKKWVGRTVTEWANIDRERLPTWGPIVAPIT